MRLTFIETSVFTAQIAQLLTDEEYRRLQAFLLLDPLAGDVVAGTGGCRKLRWRLTGRAGGKRGGIRVIYVFRPVLRQLFFLLAYDHRVVDDLSRTQKRRIAGIVREIAQG